MSFVNHTSCPSAPSVLASPPSVLVNWAFWKGGDDTVTGALAPWNHMESKFLRPNEQVLHPQAMCTLCKLAHVDVAHASIRCSLS